MDWATGTTIIFWISVLPGSYFLLKWLFKDSKTASYFWVGIWVGLISMVILYSLLSGPSSGRILSRYGIYGGFAGFIILFLISIVAFIKGYREVKVGKMQVEPAALELGKDPDEA